MGKRLTASEETALLQETIRAAHEATQGLREAIREAKELGTQLVRDFEHIHATEIKQLSNFFTEESNRHAADLNTAVERARGMINDKIMTGAAVFDPHTMTVAITWGGGKFADDQPPPYPDVAQKEDTQ